MAKKGVALEQLVALIQDVLKDRQDVSIKTNERVVDTSGISREIDVLVSTKAQEMPYQIAFECKEYSKKQVDIQIVDAMIGKYKYLPHIHRKVLVSASGFTNNAIKRANDEDIALSSLEDLSLETLFSDTKSYNPILKYNFQEGALTISSDNKEDLETIECFDCYLVKDDSLYDFRVEAEKKLFEMSSRMFLAKKFMENKKKPFEITLAFHFEGNTLYLKNKAGKKIEVKEVKIPISIDFELDEGKIVKQQKLVQGKEVIITENEFENNNRPYRAVIIESDDKWGAAFKIDEQYVKPSMRLSQ